MNNLIAKDFNGSRVHTFIWNGRPCWIANEVVSLFGYAEGSVTIQDCIEAEDFEAGIEYDVLRGEDLRAFKQVVGQVTNGDLVTSLKFTPQLTIFYEDGLYGFLEYTHKPEGVQFRKWIRREVLPEIRQTGAYVVKSRESQKALPAWDKATIAHIRVAKELAKASGVRVERAMAVALAKAQSETGVDLNDYRKLLPPVDEKEAEMLNSSQIGDKLGLKASEINLRLEKMGLLLGIREPGAKAGSTRLVKKNPWRLTDEGKKYGIMQDATNETETKAGNKSHWEGFQILWRPTVLDLFLKEAK